MIRPAYHSVFILWMAGLLICLFSSCVNDKEPEGNLLTVGDYLPYFSVELADGKVISTESFIGKTGVIVFFNTSCPDCRKELPIIQELYEFYQDDRGVLIVAIAREESLESVSKYWKENNLTIPFSPQNDRKVYNLFAPSIIPRIYITSPSLEIISSFGDADMPSLSTLTDIISSKN